MARVTTLSRPDGRFIVRPLPACAVEWADICRCGDYLRAGEELCEYCASLSEHEARMADVDDALGDLLAATRCAMCPEEAGDREPPTLMGAPLCANCYATWVLGSEA